MYYSPAETFQATIPYYDIIQIQMYAQARHTAYRHMSGVWQGVVRLSGVFKLLSLLTKLQGLDRLVPTETYIDPATMEWLLGRHGAECIVVPAGLWRWR